MARTRRQGLFITFEGTEGAGKSTLISILATELKRHFESQRIERGITVTREPGGSGVAEKIRSVILNEEMDPWCELFLYEAARAEHLARTVYPALERGDWVLCDRFTDSSLAYQSHARGLPWNEVKTLNRLATQNTKPHLTVLVDIDPAVGLARAREKNRFEAEGVAFQTKVRQGFLKSKKEDPKRWYVLPASNATPEENARKVLKIILSRFEKMPKTKKTKKKVRK
jgi:dTMP kinase